MEDYDNVYLVLYGVISWTIAFFLTRIMFPKRSFDICKRIVSSIHAVVAVTLSCMSVQDWSCPFCPKASDTSPPQMRVLGVSVAYLIYDLVCCLFGKNIKIDNLLHHFVSIVGIGASLVYKKSGSEIVAALCITEMSSPFLHFRELLRELGYKDTYLNLAADVSFAVTFTVARMFFGPYICYVTLSANNPILIKAMGLGLQLVSAFWFYKIATM
ncbi:TLC domain-containing protein 5, partial [Tanacetum coccineum]